MADFEVETGYEKTYRDPSVLKSSENKRNNFAAHVDIFLKEG